MTFRSCRLEYAEFLHTPGQRYDDFDDVCREIERQTERLCGGNKGIMDRPISLTIRSPHGTTDRYVSFLQTTGDFATQCKPCWITMT